MTSRSKTSSTVDSAQHVAAKEQPSEPGGLTLSPRRGSDGGRQTTGEGRYVRDTTQRRMEAPQGSGGIHTRAPLRSAHRQAFDQTSGASHDDSGRSRCARMSTACDDPGARNRTDPRAALTHAKDRPSTEAIDAGTGIQAALPRLLTTVEVAQVLRVHRNTVDAERQSGRLRCIRIGTRVLFTEEQVRDYIRNKKQGGTR